MSMEVVTICDEISYNVRDSAATPFILESSSKIQENELALWMRI